LAAGMDIAKMKVMKIVHIAPNSPYNEGWGYQENLLPKYQAKLGHDVTLIVSDLKYQNGKLVSEGECDYNSDSGYRVIRKKLRKPMPGKIGSLFISMEIFDILKQINPDFVFFHGMINATIFYVTRFKKKYRKDLIIVQDNHMDYNIGFQACENAKIKIQYIIYRWFRRANQKYIAKYYGVTPWRKKYAEDVFGTPSEKTDVLIMGADDEKLDFSNRKKIRERIRKQYKISDDKFVIITGGKIDRNKKTDILIHACSKIPGIILLVFGEILEDVKEDITKMIEVCDQIKYVGWLDSEEIYNYYFASDLAFFPGQHSVLWEQACASKIPCVFEKWEGMDHVDVGGNAVFVSPVTEQTVRSEINSLLFTEKYYNMKSVAESDKMQVFLYSKIAEKSIECAV